MQRARRRDAGLPGMPGGAGLTGVLSALPGACGLIGVPMRLRLAALNREADKTEETTMTCEHILVPVDFSPDARHALDCAIGLARTFGARLTLLHVIHLPDGDDVNLAVYLRRAEAELEQDLADYRQRAEDAGLAAEAYVSRGMPASRIIEAARDGQVDLIVMGTRGRTGLQHLLIGSVAERVVRLAPCPVMVVPRQVAKG